MQLGEVIAALKSAPPERVLRLGFANPHSYRGFYDCLAFEPREKVTVAEMLASAESAVGATYGGWKGGEYLMSEWTDVWLAHIGCCGETIGPIFFNLMLKDEVSS